MEHGAWQPTSQARLWPYRYDKGGSKRDRHVPEPGEAAWRKHPVPGTIRGTFEGALDGGQARLMRRTLGGYTVALFASKDAFHRGDRVGMGKHSTQGQIVLKRDRKLERVYRAMPPQSSIEEHLAKFKEMYPED